MNPGEDEVIRVPLRWSHRRVFVRALLLVSGGLAAAVVLASPLLLVGPVAFLIGIAAGLVLSIYIAKRILTAQEAAAMEQKGPFIEFDFRNDRVRVPIGGEQVETPLSSLEIRAWAVTGRYTQGGPIPPPVAMLRLRGKDVDLVLAGERAGQSMRPLPVITHAESLAAIGGARVIPVDALALLKASARLKSQSQSRSKPDPMPSHPPDESSMTDAELYDRILSLLSWDLPESLHSRLPSLRGYRGGTLLHEVTRPAILRGLLAAGLDPDARDADGRTPLMRYGRGIEDNRLLLEAGADVHAVDSRGRNILWYQALPPVEMIGYLAPDFAVLEDLLEAGVPRPTAAEAARWVEEAISCVTSALENNQAGEFRNWIVEVAGEA